ncbi:MAG: choline-sulfatase [Chlamydiales bacterium]
MSRAGLAWLDGLEDGERFFLYLHYMDCHQPFIPLEGEMLSNRVDELNADQRSVTSAAAADIAKIVKRVDGRSATQSGLRPTIALAEYAYDQGVEQFDRALGVFLDGFRESPAYGRTAIIVTSDHGEALFERGYGNHAKGLYDDEVAIPFMARLPGVASDSQRIEQLVGLIDLFPTVCDYLQVPIPDSVNGRSWLPGASGSPVACVVTEGVSTKPFNRAVRTRNYKLLWQPQGGPDGKEHALFNIREDPLETRDLLSQELLNAEAEQIVRELVDASRDVVPRYERSPTLFVPVGDDVLNRLRSLGYMDDESDAPEAGSDASGD